MGEILHTTHGLCNAINDPEREKERERKRERIFRRDCIVHSLNPVLKSDDTDTRVALVTRHVTKDVIT